MLGLTDVDALTLSMTRKRRDRSDDRCRVPPILMGIIANSLMKAAIAVTIGERRVAWQTAASLAAMAAAGAALLVLR